MSENYERVKTMFAAYCSKYGKDADIMPDGVLDSQKFEAARIKIMWVLKQDYYDSGALVSPYACRIRDSAVSDSPTWRRMSYVSYGMLSGERDFCSFPDAKTCSESLLATAVVEANKELGGSASSNQVIIDGFERYKELVFLQIDEYRPDVVIACLPEVLVCILDSMYRHSHVCDFCHGPENVIIDGADVGIGRHSKPLFLWAPHPAARRGHAGKGISDQSYTMALLKAYDDAVPGNAVG